MESAKTLTAKSAIKAGKVRQSFLNFILATFSGTIPRECAAIRMPLGKASGTSSFTEPRRAPAQRLAHFGPAASAPPGWPLILSP
jgi:hypothetical protein